MLKLFISANWIMTSYNNHCAIPISIIHIGTLTTYVAFPRIHIFATNFGMSTYVLIHSYHQKRISSVTVYTSSETQNNIKYTK